MRTFLIVEAAFVVFFAAFLYVVGVRGGWLITDVVVLPLFITTASQIATRVMRRA
jgi:hypothetical protein